MTKFDKEKYWKDRKDGKRGQGEEKKLRAKPSDAEIGFSSDGSMIIKNRAWRRQKYSLPGTSPTKKKVNRKKRK